LISDYQTHGSNREKIQGLCCVADPGAMLCGWACTSSMLCRVGYLSKVKSGWEMTTVSSWLTATEILSYQLINTI